MLFLMDFSPIVPDFGLVIWTTVIFLLVFFVLRKVAFKPLLEALNEREKTINDAIKSAEQAKQQMASLKAENEDLLRQAREERANILKEAKEMKDNILAEAKTKADAEYQKKMESALNDIKSRETQMLASLKAQSGQLALEIAEKVIRKELASDQTQQDFATKLVREVSMN